MSTEEGPPVGSLTGRVATGMRWGVVDQGLQQVMRLLITVILTKLVAPREFGLIGMALVVTDLAVLIGDAGLGPALVHRRELTRAHIKSAFTATAVFGGILACLVAATAGPVAGFFDQPNLRPVLMVMSVVFALKAVEQTPRYLLQRSFLFRPLVCTSAASAAVGGSIGVVLAVTGHGVWALVAYYVSEACTKLVTSAWAAYRAGVWHPGFSLDRASLRELMAFGAYVSGYRLILYVQTHLDNLLVGKVLGAAALGYYSIAYRLMLFPILKVAEVVSMVMLPALSSIQHDRKRILAAFMQAERSIALVCFPLSIGTAVAAPLLVQVVLGERWLPAVATIQILALNGPRLVVVRLNGAVYQALGKPSWDFWLGALGLGLYAGGFALGLPHGIAGVAVGFTAAGFLVLPAALALVTRSLGTTVTALLLDLLPIAVATLIMAAAAGLTMLALPDSTPPVVELVAAVTVGAAFYLAAVSRLAPGVLTTTARALRRREPRAAPQGVERPEPAR
ncbi:MAG: lipopolysaccharide biosynthesis protein [Actinobacteria bacterium]|nr:lipopolysaccharide biosynthesis protein [Actinomycetota bacterium]